MTRYIDADALLKKIWYGNTDSIVLRSYAAELVKAIPTADVVPKSEVDDLEYKLIGVMHSVDKWLEGDELEQDEVNRAITMREKTLRIVESAKSEVERLRRNLEAVLEERAEAKAEVAREIFEEIEKCRVIGSYGVAGYLIHDIAELKWKYTKGGVE